MHTALGGCLEPARRRTRVIAAACVALLGLRGEARIQAWGSKAQQAIAQVAQNHLANETATTMADAAPSPWTLSWWWVGGSVVVAYVVMVAWLFVQDRRRAVFICYRRRSSQGDVRAIGDRLKKSFGKNSVFVDIDSIAPGADFATTIGARVSAADVVLAIIGPDWLTEMASRADSGTDVAHRELTHALEAKVPIIPVLIHDATMPTRAEDLPADLRPLCQLQALEIVDHLFEPSMQKLTRAIQKMPRRKKVLAD